LLVASSELPFAELPTLRDVLGKCSAEKDKLHRNSRVEEFLPVVVKSVRELYTKVNWSERSACASATKWPLN
jgi:ArsR family metal-binding transcriptional regulator